MVAADDEDGDGGGSEKREQKGNIADWSPSVANGFWRQQFQRIYVSEDATER